MPRGRPPKRPALEREVFVPVSINPEPHLLRLCAAEITAEGSTQLQTDYVAGIPPQNSSNDNIFWIDDCVEHPSDSQFEDETLTDDIVDICSTEKRKETAAVGVLI